jgi:hypothetical protein
MVVFMVLVVPGREFGVRRARPAPGLKPGCRLYGLVVVVRWWWAMRPAFAAAGVLLPERTITTGAAS